MALLKLKEISKEYSGKKVLDTVSLKIQSGDMKVVMGPSGCGKTTLLRCLLRLEEPDYGNIYFHGKNIYDKEFTILEFRKKVGCVFQNYALYRHLIKQLHDNGVTILCVTHDIRLARLLSDNVTFLNHGKIRAEGAFTDLALRETDPDIHCFFSEAQR